MSIQIGQRPYSKSFTVGRNCDQIETYQEFVTIGREPSTEIWFAIILNKEVITRVNKKFVGMVSYVDQKFFMNCFGTQMEDSEK